MKKSSSRLAQYLVYLGVRSAVCFVQALPGDLAWSFADALAWLAYRLNRRHRRVAHDNLRHAFPHLDERAIDRRVRGMYGHLATMIVEMILLPRKLHRSNLERYVRYADPKAYERVLDFLRSKRPLLIVTGHFGNWEVFSHLCGLSGFHGAVVARRLDNPYLDRFVRDFRAATGQVVLDKNDDYGGIQRQLAGGGYLGLVGDQDAGPRGVFVDFFGRPASTFKSIALLALEYSAPILVFGAARSSGPLQYEIHLADVILPEEHADQRDAVRQITERYTRALEQLVRQAPEQYFWLHRRWKHQPQPRGKRKTAA